MEIFEMQEEFDALMKRGQELLKMLKENQSEKVERWKPEKDEQYYSIWRSGIIDCCTWDADVSDYSCFKLGNVFKTYEEAQKELDRRFAEQELLDLADGSVNDNKLFEIEYDPHNNYFVVGCYGTITSSCYRFASEDSARKAIKQLGEEKLKLIFRID